jgi:hypothetical protein
LIAFVKCRNRFFRHFYDPLIAQTYRNCLASNDSLTRTGKRHSAGFCVLPVKGEIIRNVTIYCNVAYNDLATLRVNLVDDEVLLYNIVLRYNLVLTFSTGSTTMTVFGHHTEGIFQIEIMGREFPNGMAEHGLAFAASALAGALVTYGLYALLRDARRWLTRRGISSSPTATPRTP